MSEISFVSSVGVYNGQFRLTIPKSKFAEEFDKEADYVIKIKKIEVAEI